MSAKIRYLKLRDRQTADQNQQRSKSQQERFLRRFVQETTAAIEEGLLRDGVVRIHNFGAFERQWMKERRTKNPQTGEPLIIPGHYRVTFRPFKKLDDNVNEMFAHLEHFLIPEKPVSAPAAPAFLTGQEESKMSEEPTGARMKREEVPSGFDASGDEPATLEVEQPPQQTREETESLQPMALPAEPATAEEQTEQYAAEQKQQKQVLIVGRLNRPEERKTAPPGKSAGGRQSKKFRWHAGMAALLVLLFLFLLFIPKSDQLPTNGTATNHVIVTEESQSSDRPGTTEQESAESQKNVAPPENERQAEGSQAAPSFPGGTHEVEVGDNLWDLSGHYYHDSYLWPNIYRANRDLVLDPDILFPGEMLDLPVLHGNAQNLTEKDRQHLAQGYYLLYAYYRKNLADQHLAPFALWAAVKYDAQILQDHRGEISSDDLAFLDAHDVQTVATR